MLPTGRCHVNCPPPCEKFAPPLAMRPLIPARTLWIYVRGYSPLEKLLYFSNGIVQIWAKLSDFICDYSQNVFCKFYWSNWYGSTDTTVWTLKLSLLFWANTQLRIEYWRITTQTVQLFVDRVYMHHFYRQMCISEERWFFYAPPPCELSGALAIVLMELVNEITLHRPRLVLSWVTTSRYTILVCNQPLRPTQPPTHCGMGNVYRKGVVAAWLGWEGNRRLHLVSHWPSITDCLVCQSTGLVAYIKEMSSPCIFLVRSIAPLFNWNWEIGLGISHRELHRLSPCTSVGLFAKV